MFALATDLRLASRDLLHRPGWSLGVALVLAAGLAAVLYVAAIVNGVLLRPLPFAQSGQLHIAGLQFDGRRGYHSVPQVDALDIERRLDGQAEVAYWSNGTVNFVDGERAERHDGTFISPNLFATLGVQPLLGSGFAAADAAPGAPPKVALAYELWRTRYLSDPSVIGRTVRINGESATVVAVMPQNFSFPVRSTLWLAARVSATPQRDDDRPVDLLLRVPASSSLAAIQTALDAWHKTASDEQPAAFRGSRAAMQGLRDYFIDTQARAMLGVMLAAALLVLLVACGNTANLILARQLGRRQELAVQVALGASRRRLLAGLLTHTLLLSLLAAAIALTLAQFAVGATMDAFAAAGEEGPPLWMRFDLDWRMVTIACVAAAVTALVAGVLPAWKLSSGAAGVLREGGRGIAGRGFMRLGGALVTVEIALSAALLVGALVMVQNVRALYGFDLGVRTERVLTARIGLFDRQYPDAAARYRLFERLTERLRAEPEVEDATVANVLPGLLGWGARMLPEAAPSTEPAQAIGYATIDARFGSTYGTRLLAGRWFDSRDHADASAVAIVDQKFVERHASGEDVLGRRFRLNPTSPQARIVTVVGVVEPLTIDDADDTPLGVLLVPLAQDPPSFASLALRLRGDPTAFKTRLVDLMREIDADTPLYWIRTYDEVLAAANFGQRLLSNIYAAFGIVALLLAAGGLYGVVGFTVVQRTREIGVRRALGASPRAVLGTVLRRGAWQVGIGLAVGLGLAVPFAHALSRTLDGTVPVDPLNWVVVGALLAATTLAASIVPAQRALRMDPMVALRHD